MYQPVMVTYNHLPYFPQVLVEGTQLSPFGLISPSSTINNLIKTY